MDFLYLAGLAVTGFVAGMMGALLGLGGGVFVVPALVLGFQLPPLAAIGTSNVAVVATSTGAASSYVRSRLANVRLALALLVSTTVAALATALVASWLPGRVLSGLFALILVYVSVTMLRTRRSADSARQTADEEASSLQGWNFEGAYHDRATGRTVTYRPRRIRLGMALSLIAGAIAGLLGVGGGIVQVPVMNLIMKVPLKVSTGTSNFMIGMTAAGAAMVRYAHGDINPFVAAPVALFVFAGARVGAWLVPRTPSARLKSIFGWVALGIAILMALQALGIYNPTGK